MPSSGHTQTAHHTAEQRKSAEYIADLLLGLPSTAKRNELTFLVHLLEMAFFEAYTIARQVEPDMSLIETFRQLNDIS